MASRAGKLPPLIIDTGIVSRLFTGKPAFLEAFVMLSETREPYITFATRLELYEWLRANKSTFGVVTTRIVEQQIDKIRLWPHTPPVTRQALELGKRLPHIGPVDYINAASALVAQCPIFTLNRKHYALAKVKLYEPPGFDFVKESGGR